MILCEGISDGYGIKCIIFCKGGVESFIGRLKEKKTVLV